MPSKVPHFRKTLDLSQLVSARTMDCIFFVFFPSLDEVHQQRLKNLDLFSLEKNSFVPLASKYKNVW